MPQRDRPLDLPVRTGRHANANLIVLFLGLGCLAYSVLQSLVIPALPLIAGDLHATNSDVSWVVTAFLVSASVLTPIFGRLGDIAGKRRILLIVLVILAIGNGLASLAPTLPLLVAARVLQGAAGAILPLSIGIIRDELPRERVSVVVGFISATFGIGGALGIVLAGPIVERLSWEWLFVLPLLITLITLAGVAVGIPESPVRAPGRLDLVGASLLSVSLIAILLGVSKGPEWGWLSAETAGVTAFGAIVMVVFVLVELRVREPLINMHLMRLRGVWANNLVGLTFGFVMVAAFLLIPLLLELPTSTGYGFGKDVSAAGLFLLPTSAMMLVFGPVSGLLDRRYGPKVPMIIGSVCVVIAFLIPIVSHASLLVILISATLTGIGAGLVFAAMSNAIIESVPRTHTGEASGVNTIVRTMGGAIGAAVCGAVIASNLTPGRIPSDDAFTTGFAVSALVALVSVAAAVALPSARRRRQDALAEGVEDLPAAVRTHG